MKKGGAATWERRRPFIRPSEGMGVWKAGKEDQIVLAGAACFGCSTGFSTLAGIALVEGATASHESEAACFIFGAVPEPSEL